jgi:two-component system response regulator HydG
MAEQGFVSTLDILVEQHKSLPTLDEVAYEHAVNVLVHVNDNMSAAARVLGVDRRTLYRKLERWKARYA